MAVGKSIRIYLADATVIGTRYAELLNWTGHAIACQGNRISELNKWPEAANPEVYFLFESRLEDLKPIDYIGESENVSQRLTLHHRSKEYWNDAIIFTRKDENLTKAHFKYLESTWVGLAKLADRYQLENGSTPLESGLPRADRDSMEEFIVYLHMVLGVLGYPLIEPILKKKYQEFNLENEAINPQREYTFTVNNLTAKRGATDEGFVLKMGLFLAKTTTDSVPGKLASIKDRLLKEGGNRLVATADILLCSSSYAAAIVAGTSRSGPQSWKTASGKTMKQIEDASLANE